MILIKWLIIQRMENTWYKDELKYQLTVDQRDRYMNLDAFVDYILSPIILSFIGWSHVRRKCNIICNSIIKETCECKNQIKINNQEDLEMQKLKESQKECIRIADTRYLFYKNKNMHIMDLYRDVQFKTKTQHDQRVSFDSSFIVLEKGFKLLFLRIPWSLKSFSRELKTKYRLPGSRTTHLNHILTVHHGSILKTQNLHQYKNLFRCFFYIIICTR